MSVILPIPISTVEKQVEQPSLTYRLDLEKGRIIGRVDGMEAVNQYIRKALISPRFRCLIYDNQYGSELKESIIASDVSSEYVETEIARIIKDALLIDSRVLDVYDFSMELMDERAIIRFKAATVFGETVIEEVI